MGDLFADAAARVKESRRAGWCAQCQRELLRVKYSDEKLRRVCLKCGLGVVESEGGVMVIESLGVHRRDQGLMELSVGVVGQFSRKCTLCHREWFDDLGKGELC